MSLPSWSRLRSAITVTGNVSSSPSFHRVEASVRLFAALVVIGMTVAVIYHSVLTAFGIPYPWGTFLYVPADRFNDWFNSLALAATHDPYFTKNGGAYFPFSYLMLQAGDFTSLILSLLVFKSIAAVLIAAGVVLFWRHYFLPLQPVEERNARGNFAVLLPLFLIAFLNYPLWFGLDRGNLDLWICGLCLIYVAELKTRKSWLGPLALGAAVALKGYPLAFILLGLRQRRFRESAVVVVVAVLFTLAALASFESGVAPSWNAFQKGQKGFWLENVIGIGSLNFSTDPYNAFWGLAWIGLHAYREFFAAAPHEAIAAPAQAVATLPGPAAVQGALLPAINHQRVMIANAYVAVTTTLAGISSFFVLFVPASNWRRVTVIAVTAILYPHVAGDYKLLMLLPVVFTLLAEPSGSKQQTCAFWLLAVLMIPEGYFFIYGRGNSMFFHPVLIVWLWWTAIWEPKSWREWLHMARSKRWRTVGSNKL